MAAWRDQRGRHARPEPQEGSGSGERIIVVRKRTGLRNLRRAILAVVWLVMVLVVVVVAGVFVLTGTDWGRERVRIYAQNWLNGVIHGHATIGRLSGNLLVGMTVHDLTITDSSGAPFAAVESFTADYSILLLLHKRIWLNRAVAVRPLIVLDRPPNQPWNWQRIFPRDTIPKPPSQQTQWGDWIRFTNAQVIGGQLIVRTPWNPAEHLSRAARDSAVRDALGGGSRLLIRRVPGGFQKTVQLDSITADVPFLRLSEPGYPNRLVEVASLRTNAYPFRPPGAAVRDLKGVFPFNNDSVWWKGAAVKLPNSSASGDGVYHLNTGDLTLSVHSNPASFADLRWVYPRLPANGRGKLDLRLSWKGSVQDYLLYNADVTMGGARARGSFGITLNDTIAIHGTNLRFSGIDTRTLEQLIPHFKSPRRGTFAGRAIVSGGRHALMVDGDVTFDDQIAGNNRVIGRGEIGFLNNGGIRARNLRVQMLPVQVALARTWYPALPIGGTVTGSATINGSTNTQLAVNGSIDHVDRGARSGLTGKATVRLAAGQRGSWFDIDVNTHPVSLVEVGRFLPAAGLQGSAAGPVRLVGSTRELHVRGDLRLPDGGRFRASGSLDLTNDKGYDLIASLSTLNLHTISTKAPVTALTGQVSANGRGTSMPMLYGTFAADLSTSRWDTLGVDTASVRVSIVRSVANFQHLFVRAKHTSVTASGTFGLAQERVGELSFVASVDSLGVFSRWIPQIPGSPKSVAPRPQVVSRAMARARADSARIARTNDIERLLNGRPGPKLVVNAPKPVPTDSVAGAVRAAGKLRGNIYDFDLTGRAAGQNVVVRGNSAKAFASVFAWTDARTPRAKLSVGLDADSVSIMGFAFDTLNARLTYASPGGHVELALTQPGNRQYSARGDYTFFPDRKQLRLADMTFRFDTTYWSMPHPSSIEWGGAGLRLSNFELRNRGNGRLFASGLLPTSGTSDFVLEVDNFPISNIADITQSDINVTGILTLRGGMTGTLSNPAFRGAFGLVGATYNGDTIPELRGRFGYADQQLVAQVDALRSNGKTMTTADARLPINLALTGVTGDRLLPQPMAVDITGDSLPIDLIPDFTDLVSNVHGHAAGKIVIRGTLRRPTLIGGMTLNNGSVTITASGAAITDMVGAVRMVNDTVFVDSIVGKAKGSVKLRGTLGVGSWREPTFNLFLVANDAELLHNEYGNLYFDAGLALSGPFAGAYLSGAVTVRQGVAYAPEPGTHHYVIGAGDPALFNVLDTTVAAQRELFPAQSPLLQNLRIDVSLNVNRDTWVRNREANVEVYTEDPMMVHQEDQALTLTGVVTTDRGEYDFMSKRFQIKRGSAMFVGTPDLNPTLQVTGEYQVLVATRGALNIRVIVGGTLRRPKLSLESDAQPPKTQSELLSLLAFGQSTTSLFSSTSSSIAGTAATMDMFGAGAQLAVRQMESAALGVAIQQIESEAGRAFGTDVFTIEAADVPSELTSGKGSLNSFFTQTKIEAGKYINPRTFVSAQFQAGMPGLGIDHRTTDGWRFTGTIEPRVLLREPTLIDQPYQVIRSYGGFIIREWRF